MTDDSRPQELPPYVYVPCSPVAEGDPELTVDLRRTRTGQVALLVYSALDRLVDNCGEHQAWTALPATDLERIREATGYELILLDVCIPEHLRKGAGGEPA
ncbi:SAV_915 family protein [Actinoplanes subglobosus]|uniref:SAV_915 family protein n=1 Tax=Actinoplanes subglobosus TaxID=1547892 RepID=A0ABV8J0Z8_9ACTN